MENLKRYATVNKGYSNYMVSVICFDSSDSYDKTVVLSTNLTKAKANKICTDYNQNLKANNLLSKFA